MTEEKEYVTREEYEKLKKRIEEVEAKCETSVLEKLDWHKAEKVIEATKPTTSVTEAVEKEETEEAETEQETQDET